MVLKINRVGKERDNILFYGVNLGLEFVLTAKC